MSRPTIDISRIAYEHYPLKKALWHRPEVELAALTDDTLDYFHFSAVPDVDRFLDEFDALIAALQEMGTEVLLVIAYLPGSSQLPGRWTPSRCNTKSRLSTPVGWPKDQDARVAWLLRRLEDVSPRPVHTVRRTVAHRSGTCQAGVVVSKPR